MKIIAVDDERLVLNNLITKLSKVQPTAEIKGYTEPKTALEEVKNGFDAEVAFLDIEMYEMNGIELALRLKRILPKINIIFVTGFSEYMPDAFALRVSGYITKPVNLEQIKEELDNLRNPVVMNHVPIRIQTFGNFEIFVQGKPVKFQRSRTKEVLAYLIDRKGVGITMKELAAVLYEDRSYERSLQSQLRVHISDLQKTLKEEKVSEIVVKKRNFISVDISKFECDYYQFLEGDISAINAFTGEYMTNYSWAEFTTGQLFYIKKDRI